MTSGLRISKPFKPHIYWCSRSRAWRTTGHSRKAKFSPIERWHQAGALASSWNKAEGDRLANAWAKQA